MFIAILLVIISPFTALLPAIYITYKILTKKVAIDKNPWNIGLLILFVWALISGILNRSLVSTVLSAAFFMYFCVSVYFENHYNNEDKIETIFRYFLYFSIGTAVFGIFEKIYFTYFDSKLWKTLLGIAGYDQSIPHRIYSTFGNPNVAGTWFAAMVLASVYFCNRTANKKILYQLSIVLFSTALLLTGSRGADMGLLAGLVTYYFLKKNSKHFVYLIAFFIIVAIVVFLPSLYSKSLMGHELNTSFDSRSAIWEGCLKMMLLKPFAGWGLMGIYEHGIYFMDYHRSVYHAHNTWITLAASLGLIGLSVYVFMKFYLYAGLKSLYTNNCRLTPLLGAIQALVLCHGFVDFTIITPQAGLLFIVCSASISCLSKQYRRSPVPALSSISTISSIPSIPTISTMSAIPSSAPIVPTASTIAKYKSLSKTG